ncbi:MAG: hypothetical protein HRT36_00215 [Alphaproteobacteria bacterium]|nr:hypothetical protein [Alphaproteobacteria bacterium]
MARKTHSSDDVVTGVGSIVGNTVRVYSQDFTMFRSSLLMARAQDCGGDGNGPVHPVIGLLDSGGARIQESIDVLAGYAKIFQANILASEVIPKISVIMGRGRGFRLRSRMRRLVHVCHWAERC